MGLEGAEVLGALGKMTTREGHYRGHSFGQFEVLCMPPIRSNQKLLVSMEDMTFGSACDMAPC